MKVVEHWTRLGFNAVVQAEFARNGHDIGSLFEEKVDVVRFHLTIYSPYTRKEVLYKGYKAHEYEQEWKSRWWKRGYCETVSLEDAYAEKIDEITRDTNAHIDARASNKTITDGLPDSLTDL